MMPTGTSKFNPIRRALKSDSGAVDILEKIMRGWIDKQISSVKFITAYNAFVSVEYSTQQIKNYYERKKLTHRLLTLTDYKDLAITMVKQEYPNYPSSDWKSSIIKWKQP